MHAKPPFSVPMLPFMEAAPPFSRAAHLLLRGVQPAEEECFLSLRVSAMNVRISAVIAALPT